ncbi:MAG TPA: hypothetical protein VGQ76_03715 [Thermoanaerobaculia bacterium]|nr:hypothetical protein [Thermoanaerobaculia bacterium]
MSEEPHTPQIPDPDPDNANELRFGGALLVTSLGFIVIALLAYFLPVKEGWKASEVTALIGSFTTVLGTIVGAFLGVQAGAAGKQNAENLANRALAALAPAEAAKVLRKE